MKEQAQKLAADTGKAALDTMWHPLARYFTVLLTILGAGGYTFVPDIMDKVFVTLNTRVDKVMGKQDTIIIHHKQNIEHNQGVKDRLDVLINVQCMESGNTVDQDCVDSGWRTMFLQRNVREARNN